MLWFYFRPIGTAVWLIDKDKYYDLKPSLISQALICSKTELGLPIALI